MSELEQKDREYLAIIATEVINKVAKGYLEDLNPELYIISKVLFLILKILGTNTTKA